MEAAIDAQSLINIILNQSPLVVFLYVVAWQLWKTYQKEKDKKDALAEIVVKTTLLWEERYSKEVDDARLIREWMQEIRDIVKALQDAKNI